MVYRRTTAGPLAAFLCAAAWAVLAAAPAHAQKLLLNDSAKAPEGDTWTYFPLRPNASQEFFLFVKNTGVAAKTFTVRLKAGDVVLVSAEVPVDSDKVGRVVFKRKAATPPPAVPPAAPAPTAADLELSGRDVAFRAV